MDASQTATNTAGFGQVIPMETKPNSKDVEQLTVGFVNGDDGTSLEVSWGPHRMTVPVKLK